MDNKNILCENKMIYQHNAITSAKYDFTACQLDILFMVLAYLENGKLDYTIHISDIEKITGRKWNITQLIESTGLMMTKMFQIEDPETVLQFVLFQHFEHVKRTGEIKLKLSEIALPYFFELKNNFTIMQLKSTLSVSSKYAKRIYALACQWQNVGKKRFEIVELKKSLGLIKSDGKEQLKKINIFRDVVLNTSKKQINEETDIIIDYELIKRGRSFKWVDFTIKKRKKTVREIDFNEPIQDQKYVSDLMAYGLNEEQAVLISQKEKRSDFEKLINDLNEKLRKGKIGIETNNVAYLVGIYQKKGILPKKSKK